MNLISNPSPLRWRPIALVTLLIPLLAAHLLLAGLVVDGNFDDWVGQPNLPDPPGDGPNPNTDVLTFYWGTNPDEEAIYWMVERQQTSSGNPKVYYYVYIDTNDNGSTSDAADRKIVVFYDPQRNSSAVTVTVMSGTGAVITESWGNWGESLSAGGARVEWRVPFADLGIDAHQAIHMTAAASQSGSESNIDRMPDSGDITWSPIPVLGWPWLIALVAAVIILTWFRFGRRVWRPTT